MTSFEDVGSLRIFNYDERIDLAGMKDLRG
jgi:hypothetical protein